MERSSSKQRNCFYHEEIAEGKIHSIRGRLYVCGHFSITSTSQRRDSNLLHDIVHHLGIDGVSCTIFGCLLILIETKKDTMDPFEVRMQFLTLLRRLTA